jgi:putative Mn2+ efflux pump MntP
MSDRKDEAERQHGSIVGGIVLIGIGGFFLLLNMGWIPFLWDSWPVILIIVGVALLIGAFSKTRAKKEDPTP